MPANSQENAPVTRTPSVLFTGWTQCARLAVPDFYNIRDFFSHVQLPPLTPLCSSYVYEGLARGQRPGKPPFLFPFSAFFFFFPFFLFLFSPPPFPRLGFSSWLAPKPSVIGRVARDLHRGVEKWPLISRSRFFSTEPRVEAGG